MTAIADVPPMQMPDRTAATARAAAAVLGPLVGGDLDVLVGGRAVTLPAAAVRVLADALAHLADGHATVAEPGSATLSVDQAADELDVPPAWLVEQLDAVALPSVGDGADRRIPADAVRRFRRELYKRRCRTLDELTAWDQDLGLI